MRIDEHGTIWAGAIGYHPSRPADWPLIRRHAPAAFAGLDIAQPRFSEKGVDWRSHMTWPERQA